MSVAVVVVAVFVLVVVGSQSHGRILFLLFSIQLQEIVEERMRVLSPLLRLGWPLNAGGIIPYLCWNLGNAGMLLE